MRWLRFAIGLLIALTLHSLLDSFYPNALAFFNPYIILVAYYSMGGNILGAIAANQSAKQSLNRARRSLDEDLFAA